MKIHISWYLVKFDSPVTRFHLSGAHEFTADLHSRPATVTYMLPHTEPERSERNQTAWTLTSTINYNKTKITQENSLLKNI